MKHREKLKTTTDDNNPEKIKSPVGIIFDKIKNKTLLVKDLTPEIKEQIFGELLQRAFGRAVIIDPDAFKKMFDDYHTHSHREYATLSTEYFQYILNNDSSRQTVLFTAGGSGSGKTEILIKSAVKNESFTGIVVDGTLANTYWAILDIDRALAAGKQVSIRGVLPDIVRSYEFAIRRFLKSGRSVPRNVFMQKHLGFCQTFPELIHHYSQNSAVSFSLTDSRKFDVYIVSTEHNDILDIMQGLNLGIEFLEKRLREKEIKFGLNTGEENYKEKE